LVAEFVLGDDALMGGFAQLTTNFHIAFGTGVRTVSLSILARIHAEPSEI